MTSLRYEEHTLVGIQDLDSILALEFLGSIKPEMKLHPILLKSGQLDAAGREIILRKFDKNRISSSVGDNPAIIATMVGINDERVESDLRSMGFRVQTVLRPVSSTLLAAVQSFCAGMGYAAKSDKSELAKAIVGKVTTGAMDVALLANAAHRSAASLYLMFQDVPLSGKELSGKELLDRCFAARRTAQGVAALFTDEAAASSSTKLQWDNNKALLESVKTELADTASSDRSARLESDKDVAGIARFSCNRDQNVRTLGDELTLINANVCLRDKIADRLLKQKLDSLDEHSKGNPHVIERLVAETENSLCLFYHEVCAPDSKSSPLSALELTGSVCSTLFQLTPLQELSKAFPDLDLSEKSDTLLSAKARPGVPAEHATTSLDRLADTILNLVLLGNRPVARWRTHFFVGYALKNSADTKNLLKEFAKQENSKAEELLAPPGAVSDEKAYFLPELRPRLYGKFLPDKTGQGIVSRVLCANQSQLNLRIHHGNYQAMEFGLSEVKLHVQDSGSVVMEWVARGEAEVQCHEAHGKELKKENERCNEGMKSWPESAWKPLDGAHETLWRDLLYRVSKAEPQPPAFAKIMDFNAEARLVGHSYLRKSVDGKQIVHPVKTELLSENKILAVARFEGKDDLPDIPGYLLALMLGKDLAGKFKQVTDDRARVLTSIVLEGGPPKTFEGGPSKTFAKFDNLLARLSMVDPYGDDDRYDPEFWHRDFAASTYNRFRSFGSLFMATNHSFSFVGFRHHPGIHQQSKEPGKHLPRPSFSEAIIHQEHMKGAYRRMFLHFLFMEANLRAISHDLVKLEDQIGGRRRSLDQKTMARIFDLRHALTMTASNMRQISLSGQLQGQELTAHFHRQFKLDPEWEALDRKVAALENIIEADAVRRTQGIQSALYFLGFPMAVVIFLLGFAPQEVNSELFGPLWQKIGELASIPPLFWLPTPVPLAVAIFLISLAGSSLVLTLGWLWQVRFDLPDWQSRLESLKRLCRFWLFAFSFSALILLWVSACLVKLGAG